MQQIIFFILKYKYLLLFLFLEIIAISLTIQTHIYHKSKFISAANSFTSTVYEKRNTINEFFILKKENKLLAEENTRLKNLLTTLNKRPENAILSNNGSNNTQKFTYINAKIIANNYKNRRNYIWINKGLKNGVAEDMGVINANGIIGVVVDVSKHYAIILSILNEDSSINVKLKNSFQIGSLIWDAKSYKKAQLIDIPREAQIKKGDTIVSGGQSNLFPKNIPIGTIQDFIFNRNLYEKIDVKLFNNMSAIGYVKVIQNLHKKELDSLKQNIGNE